MKIAISGKGGVGKSTIAATLSVLYAKEGRKVIAIDADPDSNLADILGVSETPPPLSKLPLVRERAEIVNGIFRVNPKVDDIVERFGVSSRGVTLMVLGTIEKGGRGCFCPESAFLRAFLKHVLVKEDIVIMDMEAGIEHLGRATAKNVDVMLVVLEPSLKAVETAKRIKKLSGDLGLKSIFAVLNKSRGEEEKIKEILGDIPLIGSIPYDEKIIESDITGAPPFEISEDLVRSVKGIKERLDKLIHT
jgi:CO dehydrogenase maturation factor